jgi:hypothetical protein
LGAGDRVVRLSGKVYEAIRAFIEQRPRCALFHSAVPGAIERVRHAMHKRPFLSLDRASWSTHKELCPRIATVAGPNNFGRLYPEAIIFTTAAP